MNDMKNEIKKTFNTHGKLQQIRQGDSSEVYADQERVYKKREDIPAEIIDFRNNHEFSPSILGIRTETRQNYYILSERRIQYDDNWTAKKIFQIGELLRKLHEAGGEFQSDGVLKYNYEDEWSGWYDAIAASDELREEAERAMETRRTFYEDHKGTIPDADSDVWKESIFCHRDFKLENILYGAQGDERILVTDWEFADYFYPRIETVRFCVDLHRLGHGNLVKSFLEGYINLDDDLQYYKDAVGMYMRYLTFNQFPFDRDYDYHTTLKLAEQRDEALSTIMTQHKMLVKHAEEILHDQ